MTDTIPTATAETRHPLDLTAVTIDDGFWAPRREIVRTRTIPQQEHQLRTGGQFEALTLSWRPGDDHEPHIFWESDVAKWIEAASYTLAREFDPELDAAVDEAVELLAGAQQPDGYLNVYFTVVRPGARFTDLRDAHELYCAGHLIEAGVAHHAATGKTSLLSIVTRYADLIDREFGPGGAADGGYDGHQEIELALVKLFRATGERRYLDLSRRLIDARGRQPFYFDLEEERRGAPGYFGSVFPSRAQDVERFREYNQSHRPVREQDAAVGHAVRAMYMYSAMADLAAEDGDAELRAACERLWDDIVSTKLYLTGGLGADPSIEGFGPAYDLPDARGYAETCAAIGLVMWSRRMASLTGDGRYVDVLERALYNGVLSGASADGTHYFYGNPLASDGSVHRHEWFGVACCPPNLARLLSSLEHYAYSAADGEAVVDLYVAGSARFRMPGGDVVVRQSTSYPWDGAVSIGVESAAPGRFALALRIPGWAGSPVVRVNGEPVEAPVVSGYARLDREWRDGDVVDLELPMGVRRVWSHPSVADTAGKVAFERGPLVYCAEGVDAPVPVSALSVPRSSTPSIEPLEELGVVSVVVDGYADEKDAALLHTGEAPGARPVPIRLVPYFSWANRGRSTMAVWLREG